MSTTRQKAAIKELVANGGTMKRAMIAAKYSPNTAKSPTKLTESIGFKELANSLGLTDDLIARSLYEDIQAKPGDRSKELALAIKVKGLDHSTLDVNMNAAIVTQEYNPVTAQAFNAYLKEQTKA